MAILFPNWIRHVLTEENVPSFKQLAVTVWENAEEDKTDMEIAEEGIDKLEDIWTAWGAPKRLSEYDIPSDDIDKVAKKTLEIVPNCGNYVALSEADVVHILEKSM